MNNKIYDGLMLLLSTDAYKLTHKDQYPKGINKVYSSLTPRKIKDDVIDQVYVCGVESAILEMNRSWNNNFFSLNDKEVDELLKEYSKAAKYVVMTEQYDIKHFKKLWEKKALKNVIDIRVLKDKTLINPGVPILKIWNIDDDFFWLTNYLETYLLSNIWNIVTSATKAYYLKILLDKFADETTNDSSFTIDQARDFSYRGLSSSQTAVWTGMGHLYTFKGSSTVPAIIKYNLDPIMKNHPNKWNGDSIPATEHSVMSSYGPNEEFGLYLNLLKKYPSGFLSIVSDTYNYWNVIENYLPKLKDKILERDGKIIIRPDSGDPVKIIIKTLNKIWEIFGGTKNSKGYKEIDPHIGVIYGDGINYSIAKKILEEMKKNKYASSNIVLGIGANTYQKSTRDLFGFVMKATYIEINGIGKSVYKCPKTDKTKRSAKGLLSVVNGILHEEVTWQESLQDDMIKAL